MKDELGWADFMVRSDRAIRRHWALVAVPLPSAGGMKPIGRGSWMPEPKCSQLPHLRKHQSGGKKSHSGPQSRFIHAGPRRYAQCAWLAPIHWLTRYWQAFFDRPPLNTLVQLINAFKGRRGINLYFST